MEWYEILNLVVSLVLVPICLILSKLYDAVIELGKETHANAVNLARLEGRLHGKSGLAGDVGAVE